MTLTTPSLGSLLLTIDILCCVKFDKFVKFYKRSPSEYVLILCHFRYIIFTLPKTGGRPEI